MSELNKAEKYVNEMILKIAKDSYTDVNPRPRYESDNEVAHTIYTTGVFESYDIFNGEIPLTETRYIPWKTGINEMLAIFQSQTNTKEGFEKHNCGWWKPWYNDNNDIGRAYSYNLESHRPNEMKREVVKVKIKSVDDGYRELKEIDKQSELLPSIDGITYENKGNPFILIDDRFEKTENGQYKYRIQFINSGWIKTIRGNDLKQSLKKDMEIKDNFHRSYYGVGYLGNHTSVNIEPKLKKALTIKWESMMKRCYSNNEVYKKSYSDIFVHQDWHSLEQFLRDVRYIPNYHLAKEVCFEGYHLDKDYFGANCYSKETCTFLTSQENSVYAKNKALKVTRLSNNEEYLFISLNDCANTLNLSTSGLRTAFNRPERLTRGEYSKFKFEYVNCEDDHVYRYELSRNQVNELIHNLKNNKHSRRHMTSFFNWANINKKMLVECAMETHWSYYKKDNIEFVDVTLIQRSSDYLTASHINKIQYVAFAMAILKECGYTLGKFNHFMQNPHIYDRQIEQAEITLSRIKDLKKRPVQSNIRFKLNVPDGTSFYDITADDFELIDYNPIKPQLKFDLAI